MTAPTRRPPVLPAGPRLAARAKAERTKQLRRRLWRSGVAALGLGVVLLVGWVVTATSVLGVQTVEVRLDRGGRLTVAQLQAVVAVAPGTPLVRVDTEAVASRVRRVDGVATVVVRRGWPTTLRITVVGRQPVAGVRRAEGWSEIDASGTLFSPLTAQPVGLPVLDVAQPAPGDEATRSALRVLLSLPVDLGRQVTSVQAPSPAGIRLLLAGGQTVNWGPPGETANRGAAVQALLARGARTIDVASPGVATTGPG